MKYVYILMLICTVAGLFLIESTKHGLKLKKAMPELKLESYDSPSYFRGGRWKY